MTLERKTALKQISDRRLTEEFDGRMPFNSLDRRGASRTAPKAKRWTDTGPDDAMVALIWVRDQGKCACCAAVIPPNGRRNYEWCIAHRMLRAHGVDNSASNLYLSCGNPHWGCEYDTHKYPAKSYAAGRMVSFADIPSEVPMVHAVLGTVLLDDGGGYTRVEAEFIPGVEVDEPW